MSPASPVAPTRDLASAPQASYPFAAFALQATLGVRAQAPVSPERGVTA